MEVNFQPLQDLAVKVCQLKINNESLIVSLSKREELMKNLNLFSKTLSAGPLLYFWHRNTHSRRRK